MSSSSAEELRERAVRSSELQVDLAALSDRGRVREGNEDHYLIARFGRSLDLLGTNVPDGILPTELSEYGHVLIVADGMGGHAGGAEASQRAIAVLVEQVLATPDWILRLDGPTAERAAQRSAERVRQAGMAIREEAARRPELAGMGTTLTMAVTFGLDLVLTHVGDSRAYLLRDGELKLLSRDHTMAQDFLDQGDGEMASRFRHVLTHALGGRNAEPQSGSWRLVHGDRLLLCSDGLTDLIDDRSIAAILMQHPSSQDACRALIDRALEAGGKDNVTVAIGGFRTGTQE